jgi:endonuclease YncB( thermonuclease family)
MATRSSASNVVPFRRRRHSGAAISIVLGIAIAGALLIIALSNVYWNVPVDQNGLTNAAPISIRVIDGDTVEIGGQHIRLVGFDTPEVGNHAQCAGERSLGARATSRLLQLVASENLEFRKVPCACRAGTEGTNACNYGRACGELRFGGRDVGAILISEGLARPYRCSGKSCPRRKSWCQ